VCRSRSTQRRQQANQIGLPYRVGLGKDGSDLGVHCADAGTQWLRSLGQVVEKLRRVWEQMVLLIVFTQYRQC
jgi:hypothetical protein